MSIFGRVHVAQLDAVEAGQDAVLRFAETIAAVVNNVASSRPTRRTQRILRLVPIVRHCDEITHRSSVQLRNWVELGQRFNTELLDIAAPRSRDDVVIDLRQSRHGESASAAKDKGSS